MTENEFKDLILEELEGLVEVAHEDGAAEVIRVGGVGLVDDGDDEFDHYDVEVVITVQVPKDRVPPVVFT